jgi:hypothetical protein
MYEQVFGNLRKATEAAIQAQQEMFWTCANYWAGRPDQVQTIQKKWADTFGELLKKQQETLEAQFSAGLKMIEDAFDVPTAKNPEELRGKLIENWKKSFESHRQMAEAQMHDFQAAVAKLTAQAAKPTTPWDWWLTGG